MNISQRRVGGMPSSIWLITIIIVIHLVQKTASITAAEKQAIKKGLQTGKEIFKVIQDRNFQETITKVATTASQFLGVLGPFIGLVMTFVPSEDSAELAYMKTMMGEIDKHFDRLDPRFDEIERLIDWVDVAVNFGRIQQRINAVDDEYREFYKSNATSANKKDVFVTSYESTYQLSGTTLYQAFFSKQGVFTEDLGESIMRYTKNDRKMTRDFLTGIMDIILQAQRIELGYFEAKGFDVIGSEREKRWNERTQDLVWRFLEIDIALMKIYLNQSKNDVKEYAAVNSGSNKAEFTAGLYDLLVNKFYWREWFLLVYDPIYTFEKHTVSVCGGYTLFRQNGRNIVVASRDKEESHMSITDAEEEVNQFRISTWTGPFGAYTEYTLYYFLTEVDQNAKAIYSAANKGSSCSFAVVIHSAGIHHKASEGRLAIKDLGSMFFKIYMFV